VSKRKFASVTSLLVRREASSATVPLEFVQGGTERRRLPRKTVLMHAVVADINGENACDCMIRDINAGGAQIGFAKTLSVGEEIYLVDAGNRAAHLARVAWSNSDRSGLAFVKSYAIGLGLPPPLKFLWRILLEAKLMEIGRVIRMGIPVGLAFSAAGLTEEHLHQMVLNAAGDEKFEHLLLLAKRLLKNGTMQALRS
jgi:PilZ domain-containing protein